MYNFFLMYFNDTTLAGTNNNGNLIGVLKN